ncbi:hypothetical protein Efla_007186 [Eimeria flavescens]
MLPKNPGGSAASTRGFASASDSPSTRRPARYRRPPRSAAAPSSGVRPPAQRQSFDEDSEEPLSPVGPPPSSLSVLGDLLKQASRARAEAEETPLQEALKKKISSFGEVKWEGPQQSKTPERPASLRYVSPLLRPQQQRAAEQKRRGSRSRGGLASPAQTPKAEFPGAPAGGSFRGPPETPTEEGAGSRQHIPDIEVPEAKPAAAAKESPPPETSSRAAAKPGSAVDEAGGAPPQQQPKGRAESAPDGAPKTKAEPPKSEGEAPEGAPMKNFTATESPSFGLQASSAEAAAARAGSSSSSSRRPPKQPRGTLSEGRLEKGGPPDEDGAAEAPSSEEEDSLASALQLLIASTAKSMGVEPESGESDSRASPYAEAEELGEIPSDFVGVREAALRATEAAATAATAAAAAAAAAATAAGKAREAVKDAQAVAMAATGFMRRAGAEP